MHLDAASADGGPNNHQRCLVLDQRLLLTLVRNHQLVAQHTALTDTAVDGLVSRITDLGLVVPQRGIEGQVVRQVAARHDRQTVLRVHLQVQDVGVTSAGREANPERVLAGLRGAGRSP